MTEKNYTIMSIIMGSPIRTRLIHMDKTETLGKIIYSLPQRECVFEVSYPESELVSMGAGVELITTEIPIKGRDTIPLTLAYHLCESTFTGDPITMDPRSKEIMRRNPSKYQLNDILWSTNIFYAFHPHTKMTVYIITIFGKYACPLIHMRFINGKFRLPFKEIETPEQKSQLMQEHKGGKLRLLSNNIFVLISGAKPPIKENMLDVPLATVFHLVISWKVSFPHISATTAGILLLQSVKNLMREAKWPTVETYSLNAASSKFVPLIPTPSYELPTWNLLDEQEQINKRNSEDCDEKRDDVVDDNVIDHENNGGFANQNAVVNNSDDEEEEKESSDKDEEEEEEEESSDDCVVTMVTSTTDPVASFNLCEDEAEAEDDEEGGAGKTEEQRRARKRVKPNWFGR
jgi:hypothetical protein